MTKDSSSEEDKGRRSGADRRLKYIAPYMKFIYTGDDKRSKEHRRNDQKRRQEPRSEENQADPET
jgi:hypothetical protein